MAALQDRQLTMHFHAVLSIVALILYIAAAAECYRVSRTLGGPWRSSRAGPGAPDTAKVDPQIMLAVMQRGQLSGMCFMAFAFSMATLAFASVLQAVMAYTLTRSWLVCVRALCHLELAYQALRCSSHRIKAVEDVQDNTSERVVRSIKLVNLALYFVVGGLMTMVAIMFVLQWPSSATGTYPRLNAIWVLTSVMLLSIAAVTAAEELSRAQWSLWRVDPMTDVVKATLTDPPQSGNESVSTWSWRQGCGALLRWLTCTVSMMSHTYFYVLLSRKIGGQVLAVLLIYMFFSFIICIAVSRKIGLALFCAYLSVTVSLPFNPDASKAGQRKSWWVSFIVTTLFTGIAIKCGVLQALQSLFLNALKTEEMSTTVRGGLLVRVPLEIDVGLATACLAAADLVLFAATSIFCACTPAADPEQQGVELT